MSPSDMLLLLLSTPLIASVVSFATVKSGKGARSLAIGCHALSMVAICVLSFALAKTAFFDGAILAQNNWLYIDGLSGLFLAVLGLVSLLTGMYSIGYINHEYKHGELSGEKVSLYYGLFNLFIASMLVAVTANNVIMMWIAIEATTICSVFLVGLYGQRSSLEAAWKYIVICTVGLAFGLFGSILTYANASAVLADPTNAIFWTEIHQNAQALDTSLVHLAFVFVLIGFGTKVGLFPMHAWLPDAHSEAPSPVSALLSAGLLNCALLIVLRYYIITAKSIGPAFPQTLLLIFGFMSVAVAAFYIITQRDIKRLLAYSSVENMGLITLAIALGPLGVIAGLLHVINHSLAKTLMFCGAGNILLKYGTRDIGIVKGILRVAPLTGVLVVVGALALGGVPPFSIFVSEFTMVTAAIGADRIWFAILLLLLLTVVLGGLAYMAAQCVMGEKPEQVERGELGFMTLAPMAAIVVMLVIMGTAIPASALKGVDSAALVILDSQESSVMNSLNLPFESLNENQQQAKADIAELPLAQK
ncbi:hydrogenase 4 subunit F [Paraferrimonas sedimenticola]|uniref:NADH dehydrogenase n=1 Tax=Paraferrimonas sedimenticola TaxID=375674 RepID=A0AA37VZK5_9GAMM|nr:hydrogenase 4 subunit F [Paraferrimonas sedimenticola]GLP97314.1 NADH dehydrogenase [Paraferrimonas sedimenticola]